MVPNNFFLKVFPEILTSNTWMSHKVILTFELIKNYVSIKQLIFQRCPKEADSDLIWVDLPLLTTSRPHSCRPSWRPLSGPPVFYKVWPWKKTLSEPTLKSVIFNFNWITQSLYFIYKYVKFTCFYFLLIQYPIIPFFPSLSRPF